jgi:DNA repair exonuclease SbcCD ATPase subunit
VLSLQIKHAAICTGLDVQVRSLRADIAALEVASGDAERKVQAAEEAATAARQGLQEAEECAAQQLAAALQEHAAQEAELRRRVAAAEEQVHIALTLSSLVADAPFGCMP